MQSLIKRYILLILLLGTVIVSKGATTPDSLASYLKEAVLNNPGLQASFYDYKASLERVPQAGAYNDPELSFSFFVQPMDQLMGRQVGSIELMQMFPWFGTKKAAQNEAQEMVRMKYEAFREKRAELEELVTLKWYDLLRLQQQQNYLQEQLSMLRQIEALTLRKVASPQSEISKTRINRSQPIVGNDNPATAGGGMAGMGGMQQSAPLAGLGAQATEGMASMGGTMEGGTMGATGNSLSEVLRVQLEIMNLENEIETIASELIAGQAAFNSFLNRETTTPIVLADSLVKITPEWLQADFRELLIARNPMLAMLEAEAKAARHKTEMDRKMSMPMFGVGLEYMINVKTESTTSMARMESTDQGMNGKDMIMPMVKVSVPIFRKKYKAQARENRYYEQMSGMKYNDAYNTLQSSYRMLLQQMTDAERKIKLFDRQIELAKSTLRLVTGEFSTAKSELSDIIQVERQLRELYFGRIAAVSDYNSRVVSIDKMIANNLILEEK